MQQTSMTCYQLREAFNSFAIKFVINGLMNPSVYCKPFGWLMASTIIYIVSVGSQSFQLLGNFLCSTVQTSTLPAKSNGAGNFSLISRKRNFWPEAEQTCLCCISVSTEFQPSPVDQGARTHPQRYFRIPLAAYWPFLVSQSLYLPLNLHPPKANNNTRKIFHRI